MKRVLKFLGYALGGVAVLIAAALLYFQIKGIPSFEPGLPPQFAELKVPKDSAHVEQGAKIASLLCKECHMNSETERMTGMEMKELPPMFGKVVTYNLTRDSVHGIGAWTDGELYYFLRTGMRKDGSWAPPFMPKFVRLADDDLYSVIAWLRSDDPALTPDAHEYPPNDYNLACRILGNTLFSPPPLPKQAIALPDTSNLIATGRYLANDLMGCFDCHSSDMLKVDSDVPENSFGFYAGGMEMKNRDGEIVRTANLTPDPETGIGWMSEEQFINAVKYGKNPRGGTLSYPMSPRTALTDREAAAIFAYLKTVPPIKNVVDRYKSAGINN